MEHHSPSGRKEKASDGHGNLGESQQHYTEQKNNNNKKPETKEYILYDSIYMNSDRRKICGYLEWR